MNKFRASTFAFVIFVWLLASAFQPLPDGILSALPASAAAAAPADFGKVLPLNGAPSLANSSLTLSWGASSAGVTYEYCLRTIKAACPGPKWVNVGVYTSVTLQNLTANNTYYWQVRAVDDATHATTEADHGNWWHFTTVANANLPGAFSKLAPVDASTSLPVSGLALTWGTSTIAASYEYCYDTLNNNSCDTTWVNVGSATTATLLSLPYDTLYYWQVRAVNLSGSVEADFNTWWSFRTQVAPPAAFSKLLPVNSATGRPLSLTLSWAASTGSSITYEYCIDITQGNTCKGSGTWTSIGASTTANLTGLLYGTTYSWQVRAVNPSGTTYANGGEYWSFSTPIAPPAGFGKSSPDNNLINQPLNPGLTWETSAGTNVTYEYCYSTTSTNNTCNGTWYLAGTDTSASLSGLSYNTLYYWQVRAINTSGTTYANDGALWQFTTLAAAPWPFDKISPTTGAGGTPPNLHLEWSPSTGASEYFYCVDEIDNNVCDTGWVLNGSNTSVSPAAIATGHIYFWQVYARNNQGDTQANTGSWWSFTTIDTIPSTFSKINPGGGAANQTLTPWLYWSPSEGVDHYEYCINTSAACPVNGWKTISPDPTAPFVHLSAADGLLDTTLYYWQVRAVNGINTVYANDPTWWTFTTIKAAPTSSNQSFPVDEDTLLNGALTAVSGYPSLTFALVGSLPAGTFNFHSDGAFTYRAPANFNGSVSFQFTVMDNFNPPVGPFTATIAVNAVDDPPVLQPIADQTVRSLTRVTFTVSATDADIPYGDALTYSIVETLPQGATFDPVTGVFAWVPKWTNLHPGPYTFTVSVADKDHPSNPVQQVVTITVLPDLILIPIIRQ